jgi:hypothetical protein
MEFINWGGFKTEAKVEGLCSLVLRVDKNGATTNQVSGLRGTEQGIFQQSLTNTLTLFCFVHRQASKKDNGDRIVRQSFGHTRRRLVSLHGTGCECVIPHNPVLSGRHIGARRTILMILQRESPKIVIQRRRAAVKSRAVMLPLKRDGRRKGRCFRCHRKRSAP